MIDPNIVEVGVSGGLAYLLTKLILDFLGAWRQSRNDCVRGEQFDKFLNKFDEHHLEDRQILRIMDGLETAIRSHTKAMDRLSATIDAQRDTLNQIQREVRFQQ